MFPPFGGATRPVPPSQSTHRGTGVGGRLRNSAGKRSTASSVFSRGFEVSRLTFPIPCPNYRIRRYLNTNNHLFSLPKKFDSVYPMFRPFSAFFAEFRCWIIRVRLPPTQTFVFVTFLCRLNLCHASRITHHASRFTFHANCFAGKVRTRC